MGIDTEMWRTGSLKVLAPRKEDFWETNALIISSMNILKTLKALEEMEGGIWRELQFLQGFKGAKY